jgi:hypothetical protein
MPFVMNPENHTYPPVGHCIYCHTTNGPLTDEHIIPFALNGRIVLPQSSCETCRRKTASFEAICTKNNSGIFFPLRAKLKMHSRRRSTLAERIDAFVLGRDGQGRVESVEVDDLPAAIIAWTLPYAGIIEGRDPVAPVTCRYRPIVLGEPGESFKRIKGEVRIGKLKPIPFLRLIAKIAYSYAAAELGTQDLLPELADLTLKDKTHTAYAYLIGTGDLFQGPRLPTESLHLLAIDELVLEHGAFTLAMVHLFAQFGFPSYHVVVSHCPNH